MCGITGIINYKDRNSVERKILIKMTGLLQHRGPDGEGFYFDDENGIGLGHRRLAIIDLESGHQPMTDKNESLWITFNGEIYNYKELRKILVDKYEFVTQGDIEVILYAYKEWGISFLNKLRGIFTIGLWDKASKEFFLVRDQFGVKPIYYYDNGATLIFSSEIRAILDCPQYNKVKEVDFEAINQLLAFKSIPAPLTGFNNIYKLPPASFLKINNLNISIKSFWIPKTTIDNISFENSKEQFGKLLNDSIERQLVSDVPVGLYLSGGLDSSYIGVEMKKRLGNFQSYHVEFEENDKMNEGIYADEFAKSHNVDLKKIKIKGDDYIKYLSLYVNALEEPVTNFSGLAIYFLSKEVQNSSIKVVLSGQGSDEITGGYNKYIGEKYHKLVWKLDKIGLLPVIEKLSKLVPENWQKNNQAIRAVNSLAEKNEILRFTKILTFFGSEQRRKLMKNDYFISDDFRFNVSNILKDFEGTDSVNKLMFTDLKNDLVNNLLLVGDKLNMVNSVEMRVPFLDVDLVEFMLSIPSVHKIKLFKKKYLYKKYLESHFSKKFIHRQKIGFYSPLESYFRSNKFRLYFYGLVHDIGSFSTRFLSKNTIDNLYEDHIAFRANNRSYLLQILILELWYREFFAN